MLRVVPAQHTRNRPQASKGRSAARAERVTHILFVCDDTADAQPCLCALAEAHFDVEADVVTGIADYLGRLHAVAYDVVVSCRSIDDDVPRRALELLTKEAPDIPFILLATAARPGVVEQFIEEGAFDWVDKNRMDLLPVSVAVALEHRSARQEGNLALKALRDSQALHRALVDNPTYGVCQFDPDGRLLDVNRVLVDMLGYESKDELMQMNIAADVTLDPRQGAQLLSAYRRTGQVATRHAKWRRKDGTTLVVRLGGRRVWDAATASCELIVDDITADRERERHFQRLATTDALTGLANFRQFRHSLEAERRRSERTGRSFGVLLFDLDGLKGINDRGGHEAGNRALCRVSAALRRSCRSLDTPARCGGDEFAVVLPETGLRGAALIGRRICASLAGDVEEPRLRVSLGIAVYPDHGVSMEALLRFADRALYTMKRQHGRVAVASPKTTAVPPAAALGRHAREERRFRRRSIVEDHTQL
jgi:diguanylate cyclase (GGDEF)-like protein/PAS domain S-box-containing protein